MIKRNKVNNLRKGLPNNKNKAKIDDKIVLKTKGSNTWMGRYIAISDISPKYIAICIYVPTNLGYQGVQP